MIIRTQDECRSVALRNLERKHTSSESVSKSQSPHSASSEWWQSWQIVVFKIREFIVLVL